MLLEYRRTDEGDFSLCDFLRNGTMAIVDCENNVPTQISKWFAILPERITDTVFCRDEMINDLRASNNKLDMGYLTFFVLALITDYDHNHNKESLTFASALLEIIEEKEPDDESSIINRLQIAYRLGSLTAEQKQELLSLKTTGSKQAICCACLLLEQYDEFRVHFNGLAASEKAVFTEWPIYNLFPSE